MSTLCIMICKHYHVSRQHNSMMQRAQNHTAVCDELELECDMNMESDQNPDEKGSILQKKSPDQKFMKVSK